MSTEKKPSDKAPPKESAVMGFLRTLGNFLTWVYLLRVPLLVTGIAAAVPYFYLAGSGPSELVRGAFDAGPWGFLLVTLVVGFLVGSLHMNSNLILDYGDRRYRVPPLAEDTKRLAENVLVALFMIAGSLTLWACLKLAAERHASFAEWVAYLVAGLIGIVCPIVAHGEAERVTMRPGLRKMVMEVKLLARSAARVVGKRKALARLWKWVTQRLERCYKLLGEGYYESQPEHGEPPGILPGHSRSLLFGVMAWLAFILLQFFNPRPVPAIVYVLLLLLVACWILSTLSFYCDRFRVPITAVAVGLLVLCSYFPSSDYFFDTVEAKPLPTAAGVLGNADTAVPDATVLDHPIVVAAEGGGIHSGSWAVEVLGQLIELARAENAAPVAVKSPRKEGLEFTHCVRAVSGVSGGSYGLMFFADAYDTSTGTIPESKQWKKGLVKTTDWMRTLVQRPSLSPTVHDLVYGDIWHDFFGVSFYADRAHGMERAWIEDTDLADKHGRPGTTLAHWADDARKGGRPVVLFNSTSVESGRPVVFGTSPVSDWNFDRESKDEDPKRTVHVSTAARLSAAFPFVSPAARPRDSVKSMTVEHHVDGGYYDNYGLVSLTKWLEDGLQDLAEDKKNPNGTPKYKTHPSRLLVIQIRYHDGATDSSGHVPKAAKVERGGLFQIRAPVISLLDVRQAAQKLRNNEQFELFSKYWESQGVPVDNAVFEFEGSAALSWYLTQADKDELKRQGDGIKQQYARYCQGLKSHAGDKDAGKYLDELAEQNPLGASAYQVVKFLWEQKAM